MTLNIKDVKVLENYELLLIYENGEEKVYDMKKNLQYECFSKLKDYEYFKKVHPCGETIEWEEGEDVCPEDMYFNSKKVK